MSGEFSEEALFKLTELSKSCALYAFVADAVTKHFKSMHYLSSTLVCDCVLANLAFNEQITPDSANKIITCFRHKHRSLYTTIADAFSPVEDKFNDYAKSVLTDKYDEIRALGMPVANYVVYVISLDIKQNRVFDRREPFVHAFGYEYLLNEI